MQWGCVDAVVVITGGWCVANKKRNIHTEDTTSHGEKKKRKKKRNKKTGKKRRGAEYRTRELLLESLMVLPPTLQRHEFAKSIDDAFLYPTARLPLLFDAVVVCRCSGGDYRWVSFSSRCTTKSIAKKSTKSIAKKSPTGSLPHAVPLAITPTFHPWTHTSDDSYIYQL